MEISVADQAAVAMLRALATIAQGDMDAAEAAAAALAGIKDAETFDKMAASLREVREWISNWSPNFEQDDEWPEANERLDAAIKASEASDPA